MAQVLILNFDGVDGATTYDEEVAALEPATNTGCEIDTDWSKFGAGSLVTADGGTLEYGGLPPNAGDLTIHGWVRTAAAPASNGFYFDIWTENGGDDFAPEIQIKHQLDGGAVKWRFFAYDRVVAEYFSAYSDAVLPSTEYHLAIVVHGDDVLFFIDGVLKQTFSFTATADPLDGLNRMFLYGVATTHFDAVEITHSALWTSGFTPPAAAPSYSGVNIPPGEITLTGYGPSHTVVNIPPGEITLTGFAPYRHAIIPPGEITLTGYGPDWGPDFAAIPPGEITLAGYAPSPLWAVPEAMLPTARVIYTLTLTGAEDGTTDVELPMGSFQARMRDGDPSYLACIVPDPVSWEGCVSARLHGQMVIRKGYQWSDGSRQMEEIARADFEHFYFDRGGRSASMTLVGHRTVTSSSPKERTVAGLSFYGLQSTGKRRLRGALDIFLRCGDTCIYGDGGTDYFTVGGITYQVQAKPAEAIMEVTEA